MGKRNQRRTKGILPIKIVVPAASGYLAHTLDISASGARAVVPAQLNPGSVLVLEFKHKRTTATIAWCRPITGRKCEFEVGLRLDKPNRDFWGICMPSNEADTYITAGIENAMLRVSRSEFFDRDF